ncbi:hypothetical protein [Litoribacillus peritrichatus]|uniref:Orphan protein n=1 Tax=Litoribacillus peritrichatus TaxID=718191 RepID=A0ABP7N116_9GAMM
MFKKIIHAIKPQPLISPDSADWIYQAFDWALTQFDSIEFFERAKLVQPTNQFFPGGVNSVHSKAENIFKHTQRHAGLAHWPLHLEPPEQFINQPVHPMTLEKLERHSGKSTLPALITDQTIKLSYNPQQTLKPEDLSSSFAHLMAQHLVVQSRVLPPGGQDYFAEGTELLAIFMGFGVMFANSAYTFRGGCGSCYNPQANRQATLSEYEVLFALALFCHLKNIPIAEATAYLKPHLKSKYKQALKQIQNQPNQVDALLSHKENIPTN